MVLSTTSTAALRSIVAKGQYFGARGGSCSCDPCDCNPCHCGDGAFPNPPLWRVSGCVIEAGQADEIELASLVVLSLALPRTGASDGSWEEFLLLDNRATAEQQAALLVLFEDELESLPAEIGPQPHLRRAVYSAPLDYQGDAYRPHLRANIALASLTRVRAGEGEEWSFEWSYDGPMALRTELKVGF